MRAPSTCAFSPPGFWRVCSARCCLPCEGFRARGRAYCGGRRRWPAPLWPGAGAARAFWAHDRPLVRSVTGRPLSARARAVAARPRLTDRRDGEPLMRVNARVAAAPSHARDMAGEPRYSLRSPPGGNSRPRAVKAQRGHEGAASRTSGLAALGPRLWRAAAVRVGPGRCGCARILIRPRGASFCSSASSWPAQRGR